MYFYYFNHPVKAFHMNHVKRRPVFVEWKQQRPDEPAHPLLCMAKIIQSLATSIIHDSSAVNSETFKRILFSQIAL